MKFILTALLLSLLTISTPLEARVFPNFYLTQGLAFPGGAGNILHYWRTGYNASIGAKLPVTFINGWVQNWLDFDYAYLRFDRNSEFPVAYQYSTEPRMWGSDVNLFSLGLNLKIISPRPGNVKGYLLGGLGYLKRTKTNINTNSVDYPHLRTIYKGAGYFSWGFGLQIKLSDKLALFNDIQYIVANTAPGKTSCLPLRFGLLFHNR